MKIIIIIECAEQQLRTQGYIQIAGECNFDQVANPNIKSLFRMHWAKLSSAGAAYTHTHAYIQKWQFDLSLHFVGHWDWSCTHMHTYIHMYVVTCTHWRVRMYVCTCVSVRKLCVVPLVRLLVAASQNRSWNYGWECNVPYFRPFMSALLVAGRQAALPGHPSVQKRRQCFELIAVHEMSSNALASHINVLNRHHGKMHSKRFGKSDLIWMASIWLYISKRVYAAKRVDLAERLTERY